MSPFPILGHSYAVLHSSIERTSRTRDTHAIIVSGSKSLAITQTYEEANDMVTYYRKRITSRENTAECSLCMWYDTIDGVDIARAPVGRNVVEEVRLRIIGVDVRGKKEGGEGLDGREGDGKRVGAGDGEYGGMRKVTSHAQGQRDVSAGKGHGEGQAAKDGEGRDSQPESQEPAWVGQGDGLGARKDDKGDANEDYVERDLSELRRPQAKGQPYDFENRRLTLRNKAPNWVVDGSEENQDQPVSQQQLQGTANVSTQANGIPVLPASLRASSIDGRVWTVKHEHGVSDIAYAMFMAERT
jgi:hypothetical protein